MIRKKTIDLHRVLLLLLDGVQISGFIIMKPLYCTSADALTTFQKYKQKHYEKGACQGLIKSKEGLKFKKKTHNGL